MNNKKIAKTTILITLGILISKLAGFMRDVTLAYAFGTSIDTDAFILSQSVVAIFSSILFIAIGIAYIPVFSKLKLKDDELNLNAFIDSTYSAVGSIIAVTSILGIIGADFLVFILAPGFSREAHEIAVVLTRILLPTILISFISTIQGQQLRANNIFMPSACITLPLNFSLIVALIFISPYLGIQGVAFAFVNGTILQVIFLYPLIKKTGYRFHFRLNFKNEGLREILILTFPIMIGYSIQSINTLVNRVLASGLAEGSMAALNFSNKLALFIVGLISLGAGTVCYTKMSELGARREYDELKTFLKNVINIMNLILVPASIGMMVLNIPIVKFVFEYGAFNSNSSNMTATSLWFYSIGLVGFVLRDIITRAFYALGDAKTPMVNGAIAVGISILANIILVRFMGIGGLALATSISGIAGTLLLFVSLREKFGQFPFKEIFITFIKACFASGVMGIAVSLLYPIILQTTGIIAIALILDIICGIAVYGVLILFMRINEVDFVIRYIKQLITAISSPYDN